MARSPKPGQRKPDAQQRLHPFPEQSRELNAPVHWSDIHSSDHFVQFYEQDEYLLDQLSLFIEAGLTGGDGCIVVATKAHFQALEQRLQAHGLDLATASSQDAYIAADAAHTLSKFLLDGEPVQELFAQVIGSLITRAATGGRPVRIFGEMVALLWTQKKQDAAIRLEELWNDLQSHPHPFSLFCAYPMYGFADAAHEILFTQICQQHTHTVPGESYTALESSDERLRVITQLQQKAQSLEAEVADRKAIQERLRASENRYRSLFEASKDGILMIDPSSCIITDANPAIIDLLGSKREQLVGQELLHTGLFGDRQACLDFLQQVVKDGLLQHELLRLQTWKRQTRYVEVMSTLFEANGQEFVQCTIHDITERKEIEQQKEALMGMVTHELKTPLTALQGNISLAHRRLQRLQKLLPAERIEQQNLLKDVNLMLSRGQQQLQVQTRLINDLLDVSRLQANQLSLHLTPCDLISLVWETVQNYQVAHPRRQIVLSLSEHEIVQVEADRDRIGQVLSNYLANALKYCPQDTIVEVGLTCEDTMASVWVSDQGAGLSLEAQERIWEPFYRAPDIFPQNGSAASLGLGLYVCQKIIESHHGQVGVESTPGQGSRFWFRLPLLARSASEELLNAD